MCAPVVAAQPLPRVLTTVDALDNERLRPYFHDS